MRHFWTGCAKIAPINRLSHVTIEQRLLHVLWGTSKIVARHFGKVFAITACSKNCSALFGTCVRYLGHVCVTAHRKPLNMCEISSLLQLCYRKYDVTRMYFYPNYSIRICDNLGCISPFLKFYQFISMSDTTTTK